MSRELSGFILDCKVVKGSMTEEIDVKTLKHWQPSKELLAQVDAVIKELEADLP